MEKEYNWPSTTDLRNASYCGRRTKAQRHQEFLDGTVRSWKESFCNSLKDLVRHKSVDDDITVEAPHHYGVEYAQLALPIVIDFLKLQFPTATVKGLHGASDYPFINLDWSTPIPE